MIIVLPVPSKQEPGKQNFLLIDIYKNQNEKYQKNEHLD